MFPNPPWTLSVCCLQVSLRMDEGRSLGLMVRGGAEYGLGIYITGVDPGSAADAGALKVRPTPPPHVCEDEQKILTFLHGGHRPQPQLAANVLHGLAC